MAMFRRAFAAGVVLCCLVYSGLSHATAYIRGASAPWGQNTNEAAMDAAFGAGNWDDLRMADGAGPFLPGAGHDFIFLEGGDGTSIELATYLSTYSAEIEAFVSNGGSLLLNAAPNQGGNIDFGFGGVTLTYPSFTDSVTAADPGHPIFAGIATDYTGNFFGHAIVGPSLAPLIVNASDANQIVLGEMSFGGGFVLFGGMTTDNFHQPQPDAATLLANILTYTQAGAAPAGPAQPVPVMAVWQLLLLSSLLALFAGRSIRIRKA